MARGWESKSIESQMESAETERRSRSQWQTDADLVEREHKKRSLLLSRTRVAHDLERANNDRYRKMLQEAIAHLDREIAKLS